MSGTFTYESLWDANRGHYVKYRITYYNEVFEGTTGTVSQAYRAARRDIRRARKMWHFLNPPK